MRGEPYLMRILGFGFRGPKNRVPGLDVAGTVAAVGGDVSRFKVGHEVFGISRGSFAEYAAAREDKLVRKPAGLSFEQAAVVAVSGLAALQALRTGRIATRQKVLIIGASGVSAATPCSSPRPSEPRSPGWPASRKPAWSARSAPTRLSTTPGRTSPTAASIMT